MGSHLYKLSQESVSKPLLATRMHNGHKYDLKSDLACKRQTKTRDQEAKWISTAPWGVGVRDAEDEGEAQRYEDVEQDATV